MPVLDGAASAIEATLQSLYDSSPTLTLSSSDKLVVLSDLHLGDGSARDDFLSNGELLEQALRRYYLSNDFSLVLNGDIEELQRFPFDAIQQRWKGLYDLFHRFAERTALYRIVGNHDEALWRCAAGVLDQPLLASLRLSFGADTIFILHGHQATIFFERFNDLSGFFLRHFANRLHIRNIPAHYESTKRYRTEHRVYAFSSARKIVSIIGHTHRPLFESLSKIDTIKFRIEQLCRDYPAVSPGARPAIEKVVQGYKGELEHLWEKDRRDGMRSSLYNDQLSVPCLFNSGCAIGKRGVTAIEIADGQISLVHWFDRRRSDRYLADPVKRRSANRRALKGAGGFPLDGAGARRLEDTEYYRTVLKTDRLEYVFSRIRLLA
jgi:predicted phosphodiesterase